MPGPDHREIEELLGAYALDAVDPDTAAQIELHLETCVRCSTEVAHHHEVAGLLANAGGESPPEVWDGIAARLEGSVPPSWERLAARLETGGDRSVEEVYPDVPASPGGGPDGPGAGVEGGAGSGRRRPWVTAGAVTLAVAAAVVAVVFGVRVNHLDHQVNALTSPAGLKAAEQAAIEAPSSREVELTAPPGTGPPASVMIVLTASGTGFVQANRLPALPADRTYQLWGVVGGRTISLGLLGSDPSVVPFSVAGDQPIHAFAITDEQGGGVVQSSQPAVVAGQVQA
jgi:anti-sigma factor RsiW